MACRVRKSSALLFVITCVLLAAGCGDNFRQFIIPVPGPGGDPKNGQSQAIFLSTNPQGAGTNTHVDISGDTEVAIVPVGPSPVFLGKSFGRMFVVDGNNTISSYISNGVNAGTGVAPTVSTSILPASISTPVAGGQSGSGNFYIADSGSNDVSILEAGNLTATGTLSVGTAPVAVATNNNLPKAYVVNNGSNNVTVISSADNAVITTIAVGTAPIWAVMTPDSAHVFVVNQGDGTVSVIDTVLDTVIATIPVGTSPNFAFFDPALQRLYVSNTGSSTLSIVKADNINPTATPPVLPVKLADVTLSGAPVSVTVLPDGSKAYAALGGCPAGTNHTNLLANLASCTGNRVSVIDPLGLREIKTITIAPPALPATFTGTISGVVSVDAAQDGSRIYAVHANDQVVVPDTVNTPAQPSRTIPTGSLSIIRTATDAELTDNNGKLVRIPAPPQVPTCQPVTDPTFNKNGPIPCAQQIPFSVRTSP